MNWSVRRGFNWTIVAGAVAWGLALVAGFLAISSYQLSPGDAGLAVESWPTGSRIALAGDRPTLIMAAHPRCPCTRASVGELARILARCEGRVAAYILIFIPEDADGPWRQAAGSSRFAAIPGVQPIEDPGGREAARLGARTSGHVALYAPDGRLLFRGGITGARGHEGDNRGREAVVALIRGDSLDPAEHPVFGCPIFDSFQPPTTRLAACKD